MLLYKLTNIFNGKMYFKLFNIPIDFDIFR